MVDAPRSFAEGTRSQPIDISSDESENESESDAPTNFSHEQLFNLIPTSKLAIRETPIRQRLVTASSTSSTSSSSTTASSTFDSGMKDAMGTPLTPPLPDSTSAKITNARSHDNARQIFPQKKTSEAGSYFVASPPSQPRPSTPEVREDDEEIDVLSFKMENLELEPPKSQESPAAQRYGRMKKDQRLQEEVENNLDKSLEPPAPKEQSGQNAKTPRRNSRRTGQVPSSPVHASSRNTVEYERNRLSDNKKSTTKPPTVESESDLSAEEDPDVSINSIPIPMRSLSPPKSIHKRSNSAPKIRNTLEADDIDISPKIAQANKRSDIDPAPVPMTAPKSRKRGSSSLSATPRQVRSRSTGSIPEVQQTFTRENDGIGTEITIVKSARASSADELESTAKLQSKSAAEKRIPLFTRHEKEITEMSRNDVKIAILTALRRETANKLYRLRLRRQISQIWNWIWKDGSKSKRVPDTEDGFVYIFKVAEFERSAPGHLKIGQTKGGVSKRLKQWDHKCDIKAMHVKDDNDKRFRHYDIVEKIVHAELCDERRDYKCWCNVMHELEVIKGIREKNGHTEWFKVKEEKALAVVEKWRDWVIRMQPYNSDGTLRVRWIWKHNQAMELDVVDWDAFRDFTHSEVYRCCLDRFWELLEKSWQLKLLSLEFHIFWITGFISFRTEGASISIFPRWVAFLCLYIWCWFNFE